MNRCPGSDRLRVMPTVAIKICPECGREIEIFSIETHVTCECGFVAYNDTQSCMQWCAHARECVGGKIYDEYMRSRAEPAVKTDAVSGMNQ